MKERMTPMGCKQVRAYTHVLKGNVVYVHTCTCTVCIRNKFLYMYVF